MRYLKNTDKRYVFCEDTKRLFRVLPDEKTLVEMGQCSPNQFRITMPLSGTRFRVSVDEIMGMLGDESLLKLPIPKGDFVDDFSYGNETAIKVDDRSLYLVNEAIETKFIKAEDFLTQIGLTVDEIKPPELAKKYIVIDETDFMTHEEALEFADELVKEGKYGKVVSICEVKEQYELSVVKKEI